MAEDKKFYWIKLKTDFFNQDAIDFIMSQKNGCEYIVLYQMLCLKTANSNGQLTSKIGEMIIPYDVDRIVRDTKYFDVDTVTVAMELFKHLGLIYEQSDNTLAITGFEDMIGKEPDRTNAERQKRFRERQKQKKLELSKSDVISNVTDNVTKRNESNVEIEYRDRVESIEIDKDIEKDKKEKGITKVIPKKKGKNIPPTLEEVKEYCIERNNGIDAERFYYYYQSNGWKVGRNTMKDWHSAMVTWERNQKENNYSNYKTPNKAEQKQEHLVGMLDNFIMQEDEND